MAQRSLGLLIDAESLSQYACRIENRSEAGAMVRLPPGVTVFPGSLWFVDAAESICYDAKIVWTRNSHAGIAISRPVKNAPHF